MIIEKRERVAKDLRIFGIRAGKFFNPLNLVILGDYREERASCQRFKDFLD